MTTQQTRPADVSAEAWDAWVDENPLRQWRYSTTPHTGYMQTAMRLGVSITLLQLWERGVHVPSPENMEKVQSLVGNDAADRWAVWYNRRPGAV